MDGWHHRLALVAAVAAAFGAGLVRGQDGAGDGEKDLDVKLANVRREVKVLDLDDALARVPGIVQREAEYKALLDRMQAEAAEGKDLTPLLKQARDLKTASLDELNTVLKKHQSKHVGLKEAEVWERLRDARFDGVTYREEWLVNILDDIEEAVKINIEMDARIYKFDTVTFDFEKTSARAMLQMMGDTLLFNWIIRGDTLYVYKERHETLFGGDWIRQKKAAWKARKEALERATKEAEAAAAGTKPEEDGR